MPPAFYFGLKKIIMDDRGQMVLGGVKMGRATKVDRIGVA